LSFVCRDGACLALNARHEVPLSEGGGWADSHEGCPYEKFTLPFITSHKGRECPASSLLGEFVGAGFMVRQAPRPGQSRSIRPAESLTDKGSHKCDPYTAFRSCGRGLEKGAGRRDWSRACPRVGDGRTAIKAVPTRNSPSLLFPTTDVPPAGL
jgi:hypothetical protein